MTTYMDYSVKVFCDGTRKGADHSPQLVTDISHRTHVASGHDTERTVRMFGWLRWVELVRDDGDDTYPRAMQTLFGEVKKYKEMGVPDIAASHNLVPKEAVRWRFWCKQCEDTLPIRHGVMGPVLEGLRALKRDSVTMTEIEELSGRVRNAARLSHE